MGFHPFGKWSTFMVAKLHIYVNVYPRVSLNVPHLSLFTSTNISLKSWKMTEHFTIYQRVSLCFFKFTQGNPSFSQWFSETKSASAQVMSLWAFHQRQTLEAPWIPKKELGWNIQNDGIDTWIAFVGTLKVEAMVFWDREIDWGRPTSVKVKHSTTVLDLRKIFSHHLENLLSDWEYVVGFLGPLQAAPSSFAGFEDQIEQGCFHPLYLNHCHIGWTLVLGGQGAIL
jgi:hypothetical protein